MAIFNDLIVTGSSRLVGLLSIDQMKANKITVPVSTGEFKVDNTGVYSDNSYYLRHGVFYNSYNSTGNARCLLGIYSQSDDIWIGHPSYLHTGNTVMNLSSGKSLIIKNKGFSEPAGITQESNGCLSIQFGIGATDGYGLGSIIFTRTGRVYPYNYGGSSNQPGLGLAANPWRDVVSQAYRLRADSLSASTATSNAIWVNNGGTNRTYSLMAATAHTSSKTLKHDIKPLQNKDILAENLYNLPIYQAKYNADYLKENDQRYLQDLPMFIIEDMDEIYPVAVDKEDPDNVKTWSWNNAYLIPPMLKLIQDQKKDIDELKEQIKKLEEKISSK